MRNGDCSSCSPDSRRGFRVSCRLARGGPHDPSCLWTPASGGKGGPSASSALPVWDVIVALDRRSLGRDWRSHWLAKMSFLPSVPGAEPLGRSQLAKRVVTWLVNCWKEGHPAEGRRTGCVGPSMLCIRLTEQGEVENLLRNEGLAHCMPIVL